MTSREECWVTDGHCRGWTKYEEQGPLTFSIFATQASFETNLVEYSEDTIDSRFTGSDQRSALEVSYGSCEFESGVLQTAGGRINDPATGLCERWFEAPRLGCFAHEIAYDCSSLPCASADDAGTLACDRELDASPLSFADMTLVRDGYCGPPSSCPARDL